MFAAATRIRRERKRDGGKANGKWQFGLRRRLMMMIITLTLYRGELKGMYVVGRIFILLLLKCSAWPCLGPA